MDDVHNASLRSLRVKEPGNRKAPVYSRKSTEVELSVKIRLFQRVKTVINGLLLILT